MALARTRGGGAGRASRATWSRSRRTSRRGLPAFSLVGLPDASLSRVAGPGAGRGGQQRPALARDRRITVNLSPAGLPKRGTGFDLRSPPRCSRRPDEVPAAPFADAVLHRRAGAGRAGPGGARRPAGGGRGGTAGVRGRRGAGGERRRGRAGARASRVHRPSRRWRDADRAGPERGAPRSPRSPRRRRRSPGVEPVAAGADRAARARTWPTCVGQDEARHALEVAAAGGHHLLLLGPPGAGKTMLAERLPGLLPDLDRREALEVTAVHSVAGTCAAGARRCVTRPPFQPAPHRAGGRDGRRRLLAAASRRGLPGAPRRAVPGRGAGVRARRARRPARAAGARRAAHQRGCAACPLPGPVPARARRPTRAPAGSARARALGLHAARRSARRRYLGRLSGPLLDRVDIQVEVLAVTRAELRLRRRSRSPRPPSPPGCSPPATAQRARLAGTPWRCNARGRRPRGCAGRCGCDAEVHCGAGPGDATRRCCPCAATTGCCGWRGRWRTWPVVDRPERDDVRSGPAAAPVGGARREAPRVELADDARRPGRLEPDRRARGPGRLGGWSRGLGPATGAAAGRSTGPGDRPVPRWQVRLDGGATRGGTWRDRAPVRRPAAGARPTRSGRSRLDDLGNERPARCCASGCAAPPISPGAARGGVRRRCPGRDTLRRAGGRGARPPAAPTPAGPWCPARPTASTAPRTAAPSRSAAAPWRCWPAGWTVAYPRGHDRLIDADRRRGCVVTEVPPGSAPTRHRFLERNRVIAALGRGPRWWSRRRCARGASIAGHAGELSAGRWGRCRAR